ncbi:sensor histidine kinase [Streptomyces sp. Wb2n-11]|uniref:sensor histidine kinase n=1 Tax=Streptomyces sp. Wb2n-11 TaxID=1030533 RepID=UPI000A4190EB|nr:histidine kinase [Streptomyces sp. Wb2n-11]
MIPARQDLTIGRGADGTAACSVGGMPPARFRIPGPVRFRTLRPACFRPLRPARPARRPPRSFLADALLWAALAVPALAVDRMGLNEPRPGWQEAVGLVVLAAAASVWRTRPAVAAGLAAALGLAVSRSLLTLSYGPALSLFCLLLGLRAARVRGASLFFGAVAAAGTAVIAVRRVDPVVEWLVLLGTLLFGAVFPWLAGRYWRQRRELVVAGWSRAAQLEREQRIVADRARLLERARIAQDMHDSLGHELSLIAVRAGALQVAPGLAAPHRDAARELRAAASDATDRLGEIIGVLREGEPPAGPPLAPAGETIEGLVARAADSGLPVRLLSSPPASAVRPARSGVPERTAYRVVREALTNAAKHAPGAAVTVDVTTAPGSGATTVTVTNGPSRRPSGEGPPGTGSGLLGLREGVALAGGAFSAGPHGDGFRVTAALPGPGEARPRGGAGAAAESRAPEAFLLARRRARRRAAVSFAVAGSAGAVLVAGALGWYAYTRSHSVLAPADYASLRVGESEAAAARVLPDRSVTDPPVERAPAPPPGADCRYYRASRELFVAVGHLRVCFADGRLVSKTVVPTLSTTREHAGEGEKE